MVKRTRVPVEIAEIGAAVLHREGADERHRHDEAGGGRGEHREGDGRHLAEVRQRRLATIGLPVRVGDEADRRVEGEHRLHAGEVPGIERQPVLKHQDQENDQGHDQVRRQHVQRISLPVHRLAARPPPDQDVNEIVDWIEQAVEHGFTPGHHCGQVAPHRNADHKSDQQRRSDLQPGLRCHGVPRWRSEPFRMNDRVEKIDDERHHHRQQDVQGHAAFLACPLTMWPAHDVDSARSREIDDERHHHRRQDVQGHAPFLACRLPFRRAHDVDPGSITPSAKNTSPANRPKNPINRSSMRMIRSTLPSQGRRPFVAENYRVGRNPC